MSSYRQLLYHIVFRTKDNRRVICQDHAERLYAYIAGIIMNLKSKVYMINGVEDHIHMLTDIHPSLAVADFMRIVKANSSLWMKQSSHFPAFSGWSDGYAALTCSYRNLNIIKDYIMNQQEHHRKIDFISEYEQLLRESGVVIDDKYFP